MTDGSAPHETHRRAADAYVIWPLAAVDLFREPADATAWSRLHTRQAFVFGIAATLAYAIVLALPLVLVVAIPTTIVVWLYALGLLADVVAAAYLIRLALRFRALALRGDLFAIRYVTPVADRFFRLGR